MQRGSRAAMPDATAAQRAGAGVDRADRPAGPSAATGRPLSPMEHGFWLLDRAGSFNGVNAARLRGRVRPEHVRLALERVRELHPLLRVVVRGSPPRFVETDAPLPLRVLPRAGPAAAAEVEREELNRRYEEGEPLWRAAWVPADDDDGGVLVISHQHVIADAQSAVIMMRDVILHLGAITGGEPAPVRPRALLAPLTALLAATVPFRASLRAMIAFSLRTLWTRLFRRPRRLPVPDGVAFTERRLDVVRLELDPDETARLAERCRSEGTTVQGILGAALLVSAAELLHRRGSAPPEGHGPDGASQWLGCFSGVSLRRRAGLSLSSDLGLYAGQVTTFHRVSPSTSCWALARELKRDLDRVLRLDEQLVTIPMLGLFIPRALRRRRSPRSPMRAALEARFARGFDLASPGTVGVTNVGRVDLPRRAGAVSLESFHLLVGPSVVSPTVACASTLSGRLCLNLVYVDPLLAREQALLLAEGARPHLSGPPREALARAA